MCRSGAMSGLTAATGMDALSHALEAIWNRHANPISDALAVSAACKVLTALPVVLQDPANAQARSALSLASLEAGFAFSQTRTALAHALSYAVTLEQGTPHGLACAMWLPAAWALAQARVVERVSGAAASAVRACFHRHLWLGGCRRGRNSRSVPLGCRAGKR